MITPLLERLILNGSAEFKTFIAGGSEKCILNVPNDHFIIITSIQYFSALKSEIILLDLPAIAALQEKFNTQLKIFSTRRVNTFLFRDSLNFMVELSTGQNIVTPQGAFTIDTYLVHETDVAFTFSYAGELRDQTRTVLDGRSVGFTPPFDYGKEGQAGSLSVREVSSVPVSDTLKDRQAQGGQLYIREDGFTTQNQCIFPVDLANKYTNLDRAFSYPICNVNYILIKGLPTNIS
jgi:hypothetical protein